MMLQCIDFIAWLLEFVYRFYVLIIYVTLVKLYNISLFHLFFFNSKAEF